MMATSAPLGGTCWVRLIALQNRSETPLVLETLWAELADTLHQRGIERAYVLVIRDWLARKIPALGFQFEELVVTMHRHSQTLPEIEPPDHSGAIIIRPASFDDLEEITRVDHAAFAPPWQLPPDELRQAFRISDSCTVAQRDHLVVGYQLSTLYQAAGHLARLAVLPEVQGTGLGALLVDDLIHRLWTRDIWEITVNTQGSNTRSQHLYTRFGFIHSGNDLPVWSVRL